MYPYASLNDPYRPEAPKPKPERRRETRGDPYAAVIGNATMLGIGYFLLRRDKAAVLALLVTVWLLGFVAAAPETAFWRIVLLLWWIATMLHTFWLVRPERGAEVRAPLAELHGPEDRRRARVFAGAVALLAAMAVVGLRFDGARIMEAADTAHSGGDCEDATAATAELDATHRVADGAVAAAARRSGEACEILLEALADDDPLDAATILLGYMQHPAALWEGAGPERARWLLQAALTPLDFESSVAVRSAFLTLDEVLDESPGQSAAARELVEDFLEDLGGHQAEGCQAKAVNDWLFSQDWEHPELGEPVAAASGMVPLPILECARETFDSGDLTAALDLYEEFLADFPDHELAAEAAQEREQVETAIERERVDGLLSGGDYCDNPAPYRGAAAYSGGGTNPMWLFGLDSTEYDLPGSWTTRDIDETVLVVCVEGPERGSFIESCEYEEFDGTYLGTVDFYANEFKVEAYELRTGERVEDYSVEIGGSCPYVLTFYGEIDGTRNASYEPADLRDLFERLQ